MLVPISLGSSAGIPLRAVSVGDRLQPAATSYASPLKLFEYMAAQRPIVASDLPALREVLSPDENAVLVTPGSAPALAAGIRRVLDDPALATRVASRALATVADFSWDRRAERLKALFDDVRGR